MNYTEAIEVIKRELVCGKMTEEECYEMGNCTNCPGGATDKDRTEAFETIISHADKYRWHDLRKNPEGLPTEKSDIHVVFRSGNEKLVTFFPDSEYKYSMEICHDADIGCINYTDLIAWRYFEPYEED